MNILYLTHEQNMGGATKSLLALIDEMIKKGHKIYVLITKPYGPVLKELAEKDVTIIHSRYYFWMYTENHVKKLKTKIKKCVTYCSALFLRVTIIKYHIDIIHTNSSVIDIGLELNKLTKIKHIFQFREYGFEDQNLVFRDGFSKSLKKIEKYSDMTVFISNDLLKKYNRYLCNSTAKVVYNGISNDYIQYKHSHDTSCIEFLISGALIPSKGQMDAVNAVKILADWGYNNFKLYIVGTGSKEYTDKIRKAIYSYDLTSYIEIRGYTNNINDIRKKTNIELVCSKSEAFGRVSIEAMMNMNPVIASNTGANPEIVIHGENGLLYKYGDSEDLANKMKYFLQKPTEINRMGKEAYSYALSKFTSKINADNFERLYNEVLSK
jgi:L-malate glycosyltransferase